METFLKLDKQQKLDFYKSQFEYYKKFHFTVLFLIVFSSLTYFISDCQLFRRFQMITFVPRFSILFVYLGYIILNRYLNDFRIKLLVSHLVCHSVMWCTIWAIYYLPNKQYASDGFLIMQVAVMMLGFASPFEMAAISQILVIVNILISNTFNHYNDLNIMVSLGLPLAIGVSLTHLVFTQSYYETYKATKELTKMSYIDQLTGVYNRHKLEELSDKDGRIIGYSLAQYISFVMLDIDFFKSVNDTFGHDIGDVVLKRLAHILLDCVSEEDYVIRWGGEEFILVLFDKDEQEALEFADSIRKRVEDDKTGIVNITISLGVAKYNNISCEEVISRADKALYYAKNNGRNRAIRYSKIKN